MAGAVGSFLDALRQPLFRRGVPMRLRLLGRLNDPFSRDPSAVLALRIRSPGGLKWKVERRTLTVSRPAFPDLVLPLEGNRIVDLRDRLAAEGVEIAQYAEDPAVLTLGALALIPDSGDQDRSNGDHIHAFTDPLWAMKGAVGRWLEEARDDGALALRELVVKWSTGQWSDLWASYFDLRRRGAETDAHLNMRTAYEWRRPRSNRFAIQRNIKVLHGRDVWVREPWREMFLLSSRDSRLSGDHRLPNATEFCYHWAQLRSLKYEDWGPLQAEAEADRAAGTLFLAPVTGGLAQHLVFDPQGRSISGGATGLGYWAIRDYDGQILDFNCYLDNNYALLNPSMSIFDSQAFVIENGRDPGSFVPVFTVCKGEIVLDEGPPLGDLQAHLAGGRVRTEAGGPMVLSGDPLLHKLDEHLWRFGWAPIDEWFEASLASSWAQPSYPTQRLGGIVEGRGWAVEGSGSRSAVQGSTALTWLPLPRAYDRGWRGRWDRRSWRAAGYPTPVVSGKRTTEVLTNSVASSGLANAQSTRAELSTGIRLASTGSGAAAGAAALTARIALASTNSGAASRRTAFLDTGTELRSQHSGEASLAPSSTLSTGIRMAAANAGLASRVSAELTTAIALASTNAATATGTANFGVGAALASSNFGLASRTGAVLTTRIALLSSAAGQASVTGAVLDTKITLASTNAGLASRTGAVLGTGIRLASTNAGLASRSTAILDSANSSASFQQGTNSYASAADTHIDAALPTTSNSTSATSVVAGGASEKQGLLRFNNIIGSAGGQVPANSKIISAVLQLRVTDGSAQTFNVHRMLRDWTATTTWNGWPTHGNGIQRNGDEALALADATLSAPALNGLLSIDVAKAVQAWADGEANYGLCIVAASTSTDGFSYASADNGTIANRPRLAITYGPADAIPSWPATDRDFLFDPDAADYRTIDGFNKVSALYDVDGDSAKSFGNFGPPPFDTKHGRGFALWDGGIYGLAATAPLHRLFEDLDGTYTVALVWKPPAALPSTDLPLWAAYKDFASGGNGDPCNRLAVQPAGDMYLARRTLTGTNYDRQALKPSGWVWDSTKTYLITARYDRDGTVSIAVNGTAWTMASLGYAAPAPWGATDTVNHFLLGYQERDGNVYEQARGHFGAFMRWRRPMDAAELVRLNTIRQLRYPGSG